MTTWTHVFWRFSPRAQARSWPIDPPCPYRHREVTRRQGLDDQIRQSWAEHGGQKPQSVGKSKILRTKSISESFGHSLSLNPSRRSLFGESFLLTPDYQAAEGGPGATATETREGSGGRICVSCRSNQFPGDPSTSSGSVFGVALEGPSAF